jgi:peptidoglycan/LPS O-acetylase OafA/YrhL
MPHWLSLLGWRDSTVVVLQAFFVVGAWRRRMRAALIAVWVWLASWECAFQLISLAYGKSAFQPLGTVVLALLGPAVAWRLRVRVSPPLLAAALVILAVWAATGFHVNEHGSADFSPLAEALNEAAKTLWGLAYLWPLAQLRTEPDLGRAAGPTIRGGAAGAERPS